MKRLFFFAAYDPQNIVSKTTIHYLESLCRLGDVVFFADSDLPRKELDSLRPFVLYSGGVHHREYDFGSYKRCWEWVSANLETGAYDVLYLVNDSVYGPLRPLEPCVGRMEALGTDAFAMVLNPKKKEPHLQSWFIGVRKTVFLSGWFGDFLRSVCRQDNKVDVCRQYETGFTSLLLSRGVICDALFKVKGKKIYNGVWPLFRSGLPFVKKSAFSRHGGSLGGQLARIMSWISPSVKKIIEDDLDRQFGPGYSKKLLTRNPFVIAGRYVSYLSRKLF